MIRRPPRSTPLYSSAASDVYKRQRPHLARRGSHLPWLQLGQPGRVLDCGDEYGPRHDAQGAHTSSSCLWLSWSSPVPRHKPASLWKTRAGIRCVAVDILVEKTLTNIRAGIAHVFHHDHHRNEGTRPAMDDGRGWGDYGWCRAHFAVDMPRLHEQSPIGRTTL